MAIEIRQCIVLFIAYSLWPVVVTTFETPIADYENVTTAECGISKQSLRQNENCFKWLKNDQSIGSIRFGRPSQASDMPWLVHLTITENYNSWTCGGAILNQYWVITAAHCIKEHRNCVQHPCLTVIVRYGFHDITLLRKASRQMGYYIVPHPLFKHTTTSGDISDISDIGLVGVLKPIKWLSSPDNSYRISNSICLPKEDAINYKTEYGLITGWGRTGPHYHNSTLTGPVPVGWVAFEAPNTTSFSFLVIGQKYGQRGHPPMGALCTGDSGSPLVQYVSGRAVLIGVYNRRHPIQHLGDLCGTNETQNIFSRVSMHISWINQLIRQLTPTILAG